jgi:hypothetical protein
MDFSKINKLFNTKNIIFILAIIVGILIFSDISFADGPTPATTNEKENDIFKMIIDILKIITQI